jgi:hypothetical protein
VNTPATSRARLLRETRGEPSLLLDRCVVLTERVSTLEGALREIAREGSYGSAMMAVAALAGLGADPATQETRQNG